MLKKFKVKGFKNFKDEIEFDLTAAGYDFNQEAVKDGIVKNAVIYGPNGSGKSNLGYAIFDIVINLTENEKRYDRYKNYRNLEKNIENVHFYYCFDIDGFNVEYSYIKRDLNIIIQEELKIDGKVVLGWDAAKGNDKIILNLDGASNLNLKLFDGKISFVKYVYRSTSLDFAKKQSAIFSKFFDFVDRMLLFKATVDGNEYMGFRVGMDNMDKAIIESKNLPDFERFLKKYNICYKLMPAFNNEVIMCCFVNDEENLTNLALFSDVASTGTKVLRLFYYWYMQMQQASFVFVDEFDAFYHWEISMSIIEMLKKFTNLQCVLTTHNTNNMDNDLLRPDCYYVLNSDGIKSLPNATEKELRQAHNLKKMLVAGKFNHGN